MGQKSTGPVLSMSPFFKDILSGTFDLIFPYLYKSSGMEIVRIMWHLLDLPTVVNLRKAHPLLKLYILSLIHEKARTFQ